RLALVLNAAVVSTSSVPPSNVRFTVGATGAAPRLASVEIVTRPPDNVVPPEYVFAPERVQFPAPVFASATLVAVPLPMIPLTRLGPVLAPPIVNTVLPVVPVTAPPI